MKIVLMVSAIYLIWMGLFGFLFGQAFMGDGSAAKTMAGVGGVVAATVYLKCPDCPARSKIAVAACLIAGIGIYADAAYYYRELDIPGNYYAWALIGPYALALSLVAASEVVTSVKRRHSK